MGSLDTNHQTHAGGPIASLAKLSIRRPRSALAAGLAVAVALSLVGLGVSNTLSPSVSVVPGTESARAHALANAQFGPGQLVPILLEGPKAALDRQGPPLAKALSKRPHTRVLSAWDAGTPGGGLRPRPTAAMLLVAVDRTEKNAVKYDQQQIESITAHRISGPVRSYITGQPSIDRAEQAAVLSGLRGKALIAIGIVFVLSLLLLRAPVAAAVVTAAGAIAAFTTMGSVALLGNVLAIDAVTVAAGTMAGLALGVGFALLILDRFRREQLPPGAHPRWAATAAIRGLEPPGKAVLVGGAALALALTLLAIIGPTKLMVSVGTGAVSAVVSAIVTALVMMPAALVLLGPRLDAPRLPAPALMERLGAMRPARGRRLPRRAAAAGLAATLLLGALAAPAAALRAGPPNVSQLPAGSQARTAFEEISKVMGPGWPTPYTVTIASKHGPITTQARLAAIHQFERRIAAIKTVASLTGPGEVSSTSSQLQSFGPQLKHSAAVSDQSKRDLLKLIDGLGQAGAGSAQLQAGLAAASSGASQLHAGSSQAGSGAGQLHSGLAQAQSGSAALRSGLGSALAGAISLKTGSAQALSGASQLVTGLSQAQAAAKPSVPGLNSLAQQTATTSAQVNSALAALQAMSTGKNDPRYEHAVSALTAASATAAGSKGMASIVAAQAPALIAGLNQLHTGAAQLQAGIDQLHSGNASLASGIDQLAGGGGQLTSGLSQLTAGAAALQNGIGQLTNGAGQLTSGLSSGIGPAGQLTSGLATMRQAVTTARAQIPSTAQLRQLQSQSPGIFGSGYFVLAAVDGATGATRNAATFTMNLDRGGTGGQITVIPKYALGDPRTLALGTQLSSLSARFARANGLQVAVGGPAGTLRDLTSATKSRIWPDVIAIAAAIALVLALALRAVLLPALTSLLGLLVAGSTFGLEELLFGGSTPPMGGPGYLDPITIISVLALAFGITAVLSTGLLLRTREAFVAGTGSREAVRRALRDTAAATGAGLLMIGALVPFLDGGLLNLLELGVGVAAAMLLGVLIVRPVLLPAVVAVTGRFGWWPTPANRQGAPVAGGRGRVGSEEALALR